MVDPSMYWREKREGKHEDEPSIMDLLKHMIYEPGYDANKSLIPFYDSLYSYFDKIKMQDDYQRNTGKTPAYGSHSYTFGNASNLVNGMQRTTRNAVYAVGNLSKRL